jgi:hypothetical protein
MKRYHINLSLNNDTSYTAENSLKEESNIFRNSFLSFYPFTAHEIKLQSCNPSSTASTLIKEMNQSLQYADSLG